jgi:phenylacetate-CoA ligase
MSLYSLALDSVLLPTYYFSRGRKYGAHRRLLEKSQWWSAEQIQEFQWSELQGLLKFAFNVSPYYKKKYLESGAQLGDIRNMDDFSKLPPLSRAELDQHREEMCDSRVRKDLVLHATGGSSGMPTRFFMNIDSFDWRMAATARAYSWSGCRLGERVIFLWGAPVGEVPSFKRLKNSAFRTVRRELIFNTFSQDHGLWEKILREASVFRPKYMVGYVSSLESFAMYLRTSGKTFPGLKGVIAAAEPLSSAGRQVIESGMGSPVFNTYGSREFMSIAAECEQRNGLHINAENVIVESQLTANHGCSEFLITDLHNYGSPLIRYVIGDAGTLNFLRCDCGRGLPRLGEIQGRVIEFVYTRSGLAISPIAWRHVLKEFPNVKEYQVEQKSLDKVRISFVLSAELSSEQKAFMRLEFAKILGGGLELEICRVDTIPRSPSGKLRVVIGLPGR